MFTRKELKEFSDKQLESLKQQVLDTQSWTKKENDAYNVLQEELYKRENTRLIVATIVLLVFTGIVTAAVLMTL